MSKKKLYKRIKQLNGKESRATASVILVDKSNGKKSDEYAQFVKINDCHDSIYLHPFKNIYFSKKAKVLYIKKIRRLRDELTSYLLYLEKI